MAAPTVSKSETNTSLGARLKQTPNAQKQKKAKNVLFSPYSNKWPLLNKYFQDRILDELQSLLQSLPIKQPKRPASYFKDSKAKSKETSVEDAKNEAERKRLRSQIVCGIREVTKYLERDTLDLVVVCRSGQPAIITQHLIFLAAGRGCPAVAVNDFNPRIAPLLGVTCLVALGFKKLPRETTSTFGEFVKYVKSIAPPLDAPKITRFLKHADDEADEREEESSSGEMPAAASANSETETEGSAALEDVKLKPHTGFISLDSKPKQSSDFLSLSVRSDSSDEDQSVPMQVKSDDTNLLKKKSTLVFPADGPSPYIAPKDFSHLYVYKTSGKFGDSFIPLGKQKSRKRARSPGDSSSEESEDNVVSGILGVGESKNSSNIKVDYRPTVVKATLPNPNKKKKKRK